MYRSYFHAKEMDVDSIRNRLTQVAIGLGERFVPILKETKFRETGVLTPDEFLIAGENLVHHCPTWRWERGFIQKDYLPEKKQYLCTIGVPCLKRCKEMEYDAANEKILSASEIGAEEGFAGDEDSGWVDTHHYAAKEDSSNVVDLEEETKEQDDSHSDEEIDLDDLCSQGRFIPTDDPNKFIHQVGTKAGEIVTPRTYDLHITYDKFYQVPRIWLCGYQNNGQPLSIEEMNEDFSADHANKTITLEKHPHFDMYMASIHPCRHAETMKRLMDQFTEGGGELGVHQYLLVFLKFMQAVIPTIDYDNTKSIRF